MPGPAPRSKLPSWRWAAADGPARCRLPRPPAATPAAGRGLRRHARSSGPIATCGCPRASPGRTGPATARRPASRCAGASRWPPCAPTAREPGRRVGVCCRPPAPLLAAMAPAPVPRLPQDREGYGGMTAGLDRPRLAGAGRARPPAGGPPRRCSGRCASPSRAARAAPRRCRHRAPGGLEAGRRIAEICLGGLGRVAVEAGGTSRARRSASRCELVAAGAGLPRQPVCRLEPHGEGEEACFAMASGPGRARAAEEPLFEELGYRDRSPRPASCWRPTGRRPTR